jgi:protein NrfD
VNPPPSSTFFSSSPHWGWYIALYFFIGGLAGGSYFLAALLDFLGRQEDRPLARIGYYIAFPCVALSGMVLSLDLGKPFRFWHMVIESNTFKPMFKYWSPMSIGSWALMMFGIFSFIAFLGALAEDGKLSWPVLRSVRPPAMLGRVLVVLGSFFGFYVAGYTGVLLAVTNRPIWSDTPLLGMLFIVSAASTSAALMILLANRYRWLTPGLVKLHRFDDWMIALELIALIAVLASLGPVLRAWLNVWGVLLVIVVLIGMIGPLILSWRADRERPALGMTAPTLVLIGGLLLRIVIIFGAAAITISCVSPESTRTRGSGAGADVGNRRSRVELHAGSDPFWKTPNRIAPDSQPPPPLDPARQARAYDEHP